MKHVVRQRGKLGPGALQKLLKLAENSKKADVVKKKDLNEIKSRKQNGD